MNEIDTNDTDIIESSTFDIDRHRREKSPRDTDDFIVYSIIRINYKEFGYYEIPLIIRNEEKVIYTKDNDYTKASDMFFYYLNNRDKRALLETSVILGYDKESFEKKYFILML